MKWFETVEDEIFPQSGDRDKSLYRIIAFDSLLQMLTEKKNTLVNISKWEDVYENFMLKENFLYKGKINSKTDFTSQYFGQCWTTKATSDAMWRIYSPDKKCVRIKTTVGRLWDSVNHRDQNGKYLLGKVQYIRQSTIEEDIQNSSPFSLEQLSKLIMLSLFVKRSSFSHECEYRLIYKCDNTSEDYNKIVKDITIDPLDFIMNIYFDPRADQAYIDRCKMILSKAFDYPTKKIFKSSLYDFKPLSIEVI